MQHKTSLALTLAFICQIAASQCPTSQAQRSAAQPTPKLKWVELDGRYKIQVPDDFTLGRIDPKIAAVPAFYFNANPPENTSIQVFLLPKVGLYQTDPKTGVPQIEIDGTSLQRSFKISEGIVVYYGWSVNDNAHECSMNSPCPVRVPRNRRYGTLYVFAAFDDVVASLVVHYLEDWTGPFAELHRVLKPGGRLILSTHHPMMYTALNPGANYFDVAEFSFDAEHDGRTVVYTNWHRPLQAMWDAFTAAGFQISVISEPPVARAGV